MYIKHLIPLVYKTQNDINIVSKLFKNNFINLKRYHLIFLAYNNSLQLQ